MPRAAEPAGLRVWDLPTRLCHWGMVLAVAGALITQAIEAMAWHGRCGLAVLGLLVFRLVWGFAGSTYARFAQFVRGPASVRAYLKGEWQGAGHNPMGALSVLAILATLAWLAGTGLFANDDVSFTGPLYERVGKELSDRITSLHTLAEPIVIALVALHIAAIAFYVRVKKNNLVIPMLTGRTADVPAGAAPAQGGGLVAFLVATGMAAASVWVAAGNI